MRMTNSGRATRDERGSRNHDDNWLGLIDKNPEQELLYRSESREFVLIFIVPLLFVPVISSLPIIDPFLSRSRHSAFSLAG
jgi:hypothetical protein